MKLSNPIEKSGFFWLPSCSDHQFPGNLVITNSGQITLKLVFPPGMLDSQHLDGGTPIGKEPPLILGIVDNNPVTLVKCFVTDDQFNFIRIMGGYVSSYNFHVRAAFIGAEFENKESIVFSRVEFTLEGLSQWFSISGFHPTINGEGENVEWSLQYKKPNDIKIPLDTGTGIAFRFSPKFHFPDHKKSELSSKISQRIHISISSEKLIPIQEFYVLAHKVHLFMCLVMNRVVSIEWMSGFSSEQQDNFGRDAEIEIYFRSHLQGQQGDGYSPAIYNYRDISDCFSELMLEWLDEYDLIGRAFNLYLTTKSDDEKYLSEIFLSLTQGLETLHRRTSGETEMDAGSFDELYENIMKAVPDDRKKFVQHRLRYANELSLRNRLRKLIGVFGDLYGTPKEINKFVGKVVEVRNYLTHYDKKDEERVKPVIKDELPDLCQKLEVLLQLHFLLIAGMDVDRIVSIAANNEMLKNRLEHQT